MPRRTSDFAPQQDVSEVRDPRSDGQIPLLYYITDRTAFPGDESTRRRRLLEKIAEAASAGVNFVQLREKDLPGRELEQLATQAIKVIAETKKARTGSELAETALLINSRTDVALATGAAGVHLRSEDLKPEGVMAIWKHSNCKLSPKTPTISVSCHSPREVAEAVAGGADLAILAPIFGKKDAPGARPVGLSGLREACQNKIPVLALGGITLENARSCLEAGASGIAAIRLFQENNIAAIVRALRR
jgi:thiamine-phosphate pyrophosphorylase